MTDTATTLVNKALGLMGQEPVADLGEASRQDSIALVKTLRQLDAARESVLSRHGWTCALEYVVLAQALIPGYVAASRYPGLHLLPRNALKVWEIEGERDISLWAPRWQVGTVEMDGVGVRKIIRSSSATGSLNVAYVRVADWLALDAHVADAVAIDLAARACFAVTGDATLAGKLATSAEQKALAAVSGDADQEGNQPPLAPSIPAAIRNRSR